MGMMRHVKTGKQTCLGQVVVQREERLAHERWCLQVAEDVGDEVTRVDIAGVPLLVNSPRTGLQGAIIVDDDLIHSEDGKGSSDAARSRYPLICGLQASTDQYFCIAVITGGVNDLLAYDAASHSNRYREITATSGSKPGGGFERVHAALVIFVIGPPPLFKVSIISSEWTDSLQGIVHLNPENSGEDLASYRWPSEQRKSYRSASLDKSKPQKKKPGFETDLCPMI